MKTTIAQKRSRFALGQMANIQGNMNANAKDEFAKLASSLPAMILQNGFGHALAFLLAKGSDNNRFNEEDKHIRSFDTIAAWLNERGLLGTTNRNEVIMRLSQISQGDYLRCQEETLLYMEWVKKYANSGLF
jgi:CRISPR type III-B/RAMP module-associated protein Cmr5